MQKNWTKRSVRWLILAVLIVGITVLQAGSAGSASLGVPLPPRKPSVKQVAFIAPATATLEVSLTNIPKKPDNKVATGEAARTETSVSVPTLFKSFIGFAMNAGRAAFESPAGSAPYKSEDDQRLDAVFSDAEPGNQGRPVFQRVWKEVRSLTSRTRPTAALKLLGRHPEAKSLTNIEYDRIRSHIAQAYMTAGKLDEAQKLAEASFKRSGSDVPLAGWVSGLVSWRQGDYQKAADYFAKSSRSSKSSPWLASASSLWAARSYIKAGDDRGGEKWLREAARYSQTFYGMIALRALDKNIDSDGTTVQANPMTFVKLLRSTDAQAALKLARDGKPGQAITQLGKLGWLNSHDQREAVMTYALKKHIPSLALHLAKRYPRDVNGRLYEDALYPTIPWKPADGYSVDKALVHALVRQESDFNPYARNPTGATGLMQLMPATASYMSKEVGQKSHADNLKDPKANLALGQAYVKHLLEDPAVNNDLFSMAIAYNAGPGNLARWKKELSDIDDPLLFIETIPVPETRAFVERVMRNYWMYRTRMGMDVPSLDAVASGNKPTYTHMADAGSNADITLAAR